MQKFTNLDVWNVSHEFVLDIYLATKGFPSTEMYGVTSQIRRSAVSIPTNLAEGSKRSSRRDFARFINLAEGSQAETEYLLVLSRDLNYLDDAEACRLLEKVNRLGRMLFGLRSSVVAFERMHRKRTKNCKL